MAKTLAIIFGIVFVLVGLLGFVGNSLVGAGALFEADTAHNLVHLITGLILLAVGFWRAASSAAWLKIIGGVYLIVALLGFVLEPSMGMLLGIMSVNAADHWLHIIFGVALLVAGYMTKDETAARPPTTPMSSVPPPPRGQVI